MAVELESLVLLAGNAAGFGIIVQTVVYAARNWSGTPELKILREEMQRTHGQFERLIAAISQAIPPAPREEK